MVAFTLTVFLSFFFFFLLIQKMKIDLIKKWVLWSVASLFLIQMNFFSVHIKIISVLFFFFTHLAAKDEDGTPGGPSTEALPALPPGLYHWDHLQLFGQGKITRLWTVNQLFVVTLVIFFLFFSFSETDTCERQWLHLKITWSQIWAQHNSVSSSYCVISEMFLMCVNNTNVLLPTTRGRPSCFVLTSLTLSIFSYSLV